MRLSCFKMLGKILLCDVILLVNAINETSFYENVNISEKNNNLVNKDLDYPVVIEDNLDTSDNNKDLETYDEDVKRSGPVDTGRRKGNKCSKIIKDIKFFVYKACFF